MIDYKLVIFDCDGVLVDSEMLSAQVIADVLETVGIKMTAEESYKTFVGGSMQKTLDYVKEQLGYVPDVDIQGEYRKLSFAAYREKLTPVEGVVNILDQLKTSVCVASNGPKYKIQLNLQITGLSKYFHDDHIFSAYDLQKWKPDPALYLNAAKVCKVHPSECIVIEDSIHGLHAAESAGMKCLGISYPIKPLPQNIGAAEVFPTMDYICNRLQELETMI
ncbi:MAG: HAD family hydrolase [Saprospiraceae bacterium]